MSELRPGATFDFKPVTREYADGLRAAGLHVVSCYQFGKPGWPDPSDFTRGYDGGVADAQTALRLHGAAGGPARRRSSSASMRISTSIPGIALLFNGFGESTRCWASTAPASTGGARAVRMGDPRTALSGARPLPGTGGPGRRRAWSGGEREPRAVLYQTVVDTDASPGAPLGGTNVDMNDVLAADFGQWDLDRSG